MMYSGWRKSDRGAVLIVVVGILAVLSLLAATFGMVMAIELASSQNQSEHELARQAATAGYLTVVQSLRDYGTAGLSTGPPPEFCPQPGDPFGAYRLPGPANLKVYWMANSAELSPEQQAALVNKEWAEGLGLEKTGMFNINGMGHAGDLGNQPYDGIRYDSFSASLALLLKERFDALPTGGAEDIDAYCTTWDDTVRWRMARYLASAIVAYRYGKDGVPGTRSVEDNALGHRPEYVYWPGVWDTQDTGVAASGDFWGTVSVASSSTIAMNVLAEGAVTSAANSPPELKTTAAWSADAHIGHIVTASAQLDAGTATGGGALTLADTTKAWIVNAWADKLVEITGGTGAGQIRLISSNTADTLTIASAWTPNPDGTSQYRILDIQSRLVRDHDADTLWLYDDWDTIPDNTYTYVLQTREDFWRSAAGPGVWQGAGLWLSPNPALDGMYAFDTTATRKDDGWIGITASTEAATLNFAAGTFADIPLLGDTFAINAGMFNVGASDGIPTALRWPNGALACEKFVFPLARDTGTITSISILGGTLDLDHDLLFDPSDMVVRITSGDFRGLVRPISVWDGTNTLTVAYDWIGGVHPSPGDEYAIEYDYFHEGQPSAVGNYTLTAEIGTTWQPDDCWAGCVVTIVSDPITADAVGQVRVIESNTSNQLTLARDWRDWPSTSAIYRIELPRDDKYRPDQLQGDDRIYHSVAEVLPVMTAALNDERDAAMFASSDDLGKAAAILYESFKDYLSVSSRAIARKDESAGINDWATDGIDNDDNGVIDDEDPTTAELAQALYERLGLRDWAHSASGDVTQAAQVVANIMDFRDADHEPTVLSETDIGEGPGTFTVHGYEGVHVTEIMATPDIADPSDTTHIPADFIVPFGTGSELDTGTAESGAVSTLTDTDKLWVVDAYINEVVEIIGGTGINQTRVIASNTADTLTVTVGWVTPPDNTSQYRIVHVPLNVGTEMVEDDVWASRSTFANLDEYYPSPPRYSQLKDADAPDPQGTRLPATPGWDWDQDGTGYGWWVAKESPSGGKWEFSSGAGHELVPGWYAIRIRGTDGATYDFTNSAGDPGYAVIPVDATDGSDGTAYVRQGTSVAPRTRLLAVEVEVDVTTGSKLEFDLQADNGARFYSFQLLPQYVEITNAAAQDITLESVDCGAEGLADPVIALPAGTTIRGAAADGNFPIKYGTFVVALSEAAYERQWTLKQGLSGTNNGNGIWGDEDGEDYPAYFAGDVSDEEADKMMIPYASPEIVVTSDTTVLARTGSGAIDGDVGDCIAYSSREKTGSPFSTDWANFDDTVPLPALCGSQNEELSGGPTERSNLNKNYDDIWDGAYPALKDGPAMATGRNVFPIILNRPYPTAGWLGLVPSGNDAWRTIDADPTPTPTDPLETSPDSPEEMLGLLIHRALVGGVHARINLNNPSAPMRLHTLEAAVGADAACPLAHEMYAGTPSGAPANPDELTDSIGGWGAGDHEDRTVYIRTGTGAGQSRKILGNTGDTLTLDRDWDVLPDGTSDYSIFANAWANWDELLEDTNIIATCDVAGDEDSGAGLIADDFEDDSDEEEEWARRYSNLLDLRTSNLKYVIAGFVYEDGAAPGDPPVAQVRIEADFDISGNDVKVVQFRYVMD